jgi:hypothetical protein
VIIVEVDKQQTSEEKESTDKTRFLEYPEKLEIFRIR